MRSRTLMTGAIVAGLLAASALPVAAAERTLKLITHDSFFLPEAVIEAFEVANDVDVQLLPAGDAGSMVNQAILTADRPLADVLYGIDNTFLSRALAADIFEPYASIQLEHVPPELQLDPEQRVTPIDRADVCLNIDRAAFGDDGLPLPSSLEDLTDEALAGTLVVQNPATSSPGLSFLLATVAHFGDDPETGWQAFWADLRDNDVEITAGWEEAYWGSFSGASDGRRPIVVSYAASPAAEVFYAEEPLEQSPTAAIDVGCFGQIEFAGVLRGGEEPELAGAFIDYLLSAEVQAELPLAMFVAPARSDVDLPDVFEQHALVPAAPLSLDPAAIDAGREDWIREWTDIVLR